MGTNGIVVSLPELGNLTSLSLSLSSISNHGGERKKSQSRNLEFFARTSEKKRIERDGFWKPRNHLFSSSARGRGEDALTLCALE